MTEMWRPPKVDVYAWKATETSDALIDKIVDVTLPEAHERGWDVFYLQDNPDQYMISEGCIDLCFGKRAYNIISTKNPQAIELPELSKLEDIPANRQYRLQAWETLKAVRENIHNPVLKEQAELNLSPEDLVELLNTKVQNIRKHVAEDKTSYWMGETLLGKKVAITFSPQTNISCDFQITVDELFAAKAAVDILGLKTLTLVKGKQDD